MMCSQTADICIKSYVGVVGMSDERNILKLNPIPITVLKKITNDIYPIIFFIIILSRLTGTLPSSLTSSTVSLILKNYLFIKKTFLITILDLQSFLTSKNNTKEIVKKLSTYSPRL